MKLFENFIDVLCLFDWATPLISLANPGDPVYYGDEAGAYKLAEILKKKGFSVRVDGIPGGNHWVEITGGDYIRLRNIMEQLAAVELKGKK